jgi:ribulose-5-phosphate 4-epimerase/fuculose-1-phosphate aldolase
VTLLPSHGVLVTGSCAGEVYQRAVTFEADCRLRWELSRPGEQVDAPALHARIPTALPRRGLWEWAARREMAGLPAGHVPEEAAS